MFKIIDTDGVLRTCEGIDINVFHDEETGRPHLTGYPMSKDADGYWDTNTQSVLFWATTDFDPDKYYDEWYGYEDGMAPGETPGEIVRLVSNILREVDLADTPVYAETLVNTPKELSL